MNGHYVYVYIDPRNNQPFYVGKGSGGRAYVHLQAGKDPWHPKHQIIKSLEYSGLKPIIEIVDEELDEDEAFDLEVATIKEIGRKDLGEGPLTNMSDGGRGVGCRRLITEEERERLRSYTIQRNLNNNSMNDPETRMKVSNTVKQLWDSGYYDESPEKRDLHNKRISEALKNYCSSEDCHQKTNPAVLMEHHPAQRCINELRDYLNNVQGDLSFVQTVVYQTWQKFRRALDKISERHLPLEVETRGGGSPGKPIKSVTVYFKS